MLDNLIGLVPKISKRFAVAGSLIGGAGYSVWAIPAVLGPVGVPMAIVGAFVTGWWYIHNETVRPSGDGDAIVPDAPTEAS